MGPIGTWIDDRRDGVILAVALFILAGIAGLLARPAEPATVIAVATPTLAAPEARPAAHQGGGLPRAVVAFAAPGGDVIGAIEPGRSYQAVARYADAWTLIEAQGSGRVWVHNRDLPVDPALPDLAPAPPPPAPAAPPPPAPAPVYVARGAYPTVTPVVAGVYEGRPVTMIEPVPGMVEGAATELPPGVDPLAGCCQVRVTPAP